MFLYITLHNILYACYEQGDVFGFMKLSALIITELKNLSAASRLQGQSQMQQQQQVMSPNPVAGLRPSAGGHTV